MGMTNPSKPNGYTLIPTDQLYTAYFKLADASKALHGAWQVAVNNGHTARNSFADLADSVGDEMRTVNAELKRREALTP